MQQQHLTSSPFPFTLNLTTTTVLHHHQYPSLPNPIFPHCLTLSWLGFSFHIPKLHNLHHTSQINMSLDISTSFVATMRRGDLLGALLSSLA
ncbi:hypothetical protein FRB95_014680 [Tulasnella sp. JGI-2019a]|nr:hypothetical protein FRB95_014680 [Tulasnella sp. JGI-2019a]